MELRTNVKILETVLCCPKKQETLKLTVRSQIGWKSEVWVNCFKYFYLKNDQVKMFQIYPPINWALSFLIISLHVSTLRQGPLQVILHFKLWSKIYIFFQTPDFDEILVERIKYKLFLLIKLFLFIIAISLPFFIWSLVSFFSREDQCNSLFDLFYHF